MGKFPVKPAANPAWKSSDANWWLTRQFAKAPFVATNLYMACKGSDVNWVALLALGMVRTKYFSEEGIDAFCIGEAGISYEDQADHAPQHYVDMEFLDDAIPPHLTYAYEQVYARIVRFLDDMRRRRVEPSPLPAPPPATPKPDPTPPRPEPAPQPGTPPTPVEEPNPPPSDKPFDWKALIVPMITAVIGLIAGSLGPWGSVLKAIWSAIVAIIGA